MLVGEWALSGWGEEGVTLFLNVLAGCGARAFGDGFREYGEKLANG